MTDTLTKWKKLCEEATEGPWHSFAGVIRADGGLIGCNDPDNYKTGTNDSRFIAESRTAMPRLISAVEWLWGQVETNSELYENGDVEQYRKVLEKILKGAGDG